MHLAVSEIEIRAITICLLVVFVGVEITYQKNCIVYIGETEVEPSGKSRFKIGAVFSPVRLVCLEDIDRDTVIY